MYQFIIAAVSEIYYVFHRLVRSVVKRKNRLPYLTIANNLELEVCTNLCSNKSRTNIITNGMNNLNC